MFVRALNIFLLISYVCRFVVFNSCMKSFSYGGKKVKDVGLTCTCDLSYIIPNSIFYDIKGWRGGINCFCYFFEGRITTVFHNIREMVSVLFL